MREKLRNLKGGGLWDTLVQFVKFGLVGVSNMAISYGIEMLCYYVLLVNAPLSEGVRVVVTSALAFIVSVTNSYYWNSRYVFKSGGKKKTLSEHLSSYAKTVASYGVTGLLLAPALKLLLGSWGVPYWIASLGSLIVTIPLNYVLNKFWAFSAPKALTKEEEEI